MGHRRNFLPVNFARKSLILNPFFEIEFCRDKRCFVDEVSTLRCHLEAHHSVSYYLNILLLVLISFRDDIAIGQRVTSTTQNSQVMSRNARQLLKLRREPWTVTLWRRRLQNE
jgi:hypothetical protein